MFAAARTVSAVELWAVDRYLDIVLCHYEHQSSVSLFSIHQLSTAYCLQSIFGDILNEQFAP